MDYIKIILLEAVVNGDIETIKKFLVSENINVQDSHGLTMLNLAVKHYNDNYHIISYLINKGADVNIGDKSNITPLIRAAANGFTKVIKLLIFGGADVNCVTKYQDTALHLASRKGFSEIIEFLLDHKAEIKTDRNGNTPLHIASIYCNCSVAEVLLKNGSKFDTINFQGKTPYDYAQESSLKAMAKIFYKYIPNSRTNFNEKLLKAIHQADLNVIKELVTTESINIQDNTGKTLLHYAAKKPNRLVVELLLLKGADPKIKDSTGKIPNDYAHDSQGPQIYEIIPTKSLTQTTKFKLTRTLKSECKLTTTLSQLLGYDFRTTQRLDNYPLHKAAVDDDYTLCSQLLQEGFKVSSEDDNGNTPLHYAASFGYKKLVSLFITKGAKLAVINNFGKMPYECARERGYDSIHESLFKATILSMQHHLEPNLLETCMSTTLINSCLIGENSIEMYTRSHDEFIDLCPLQNNFITKT